MTKTTDVDQMVLPALKEFNKVSTHLEGKVTREALALALYGEITCRRMPLTTVYDTLPPEAAAAKVRALFSETPAVPRSVYKALKPVIEVMETQGHSGSSASFVGARIVRTTLPHVSEGAILVNDLSAGWYNVRQFQETLISGLGQNGFRAMVKADSDLGKFLREIESKAEEIRSLKSPLYISGAANPKMGDGKTRVLYIGGFSNNLEGEFRAIASDLQFANGNAIVYSLTHTILTVPVFAKKLIMLGRTLTDNANDFVNMADAYVELVGDGFGDASDAMARAAVNRARENKTPTLILTKQNRVAKTPSYAQQFLKDNQDVLTWTYDGPKAASERVMRFTAETFDGTPAPNQQEDAWKSALDNAVKSYLR